jgi:hypothetical protein
LPFKQFLPFLLHSFGRAVASLALVLLLFGMGVFGIIMAILILLALAGNACVVVVVPSSSSSSCRVVAVT